MAFREIPPFVPCTGSRIRCCFAHRDGNVDPGDFECGQRCGFCSRMVNPAGYPAEEISPLDGDGNATLGAGDLEAISLLDR